MKKKQSLEKEDIPYIESEIIYIESRFNHLGKSIEFFQVKPGVYRGLYEGIHFTLEFHQIDKNKRFIYWFKFTQVDTMKRFKVGIGIMSKGRNWYSQQLDMFQVIDNAYNKLRAILDEVPHKYMREYFSSVGIDEKCYTVECYHGSYTATFHGKKTIEVTFKSSANDRKFYPLNIYEDNKHLEKVIVDRLGFSSRVNLTSQEKMDYLLQSEVIRSIRLEKKCNPEDTGIITRSNIF